MASLALLIVAALLPVRPVQAMQFETVGISAADVLIGGRGPIVHGDTGRLEKALASIPSTKHLIGLALDSPGGTIVDGVELARIIRNRGLTVIIPTNSKCASTCFLMLAAAPHRLAANDALIGVHGASDEGKDTAAAMAMTTAMARAAAELGVPTSIIGTMVTTAPSRVEWLTHEDLATMNVVIYDEANAPIAARPVNPAVTRPSATRSPSPATAVPPPSDPAGQAEAEFHGALFCGRDPVQLYLRLLPSADPTHRRALYTLGAGSTGRTGASGSAAVEGRIDLTGGMIDLSPVQGSAHDGPGPVGLQGKSDDGGRTFSGRVTVNPHCTVFTLKRMS